MASGVAGSWHRDANGVGGRQAGNTEHRRTHVLPQMFWNDELAYLRAPRHEVSTHARHAVQ